MELEKMHVRRRILHYVWARKNVLENKLENLPVLVKSL